MSVRPHLLYTAWGFPPSRAGGVYRALATVNAFAARGWDVTVLTTPRELFIDSTGGDEALEGQIHPAVHVERLPVTTPAFSADIRAWSRWRARYPELWIAADWRRDLLRFPEPAYGRWRPALQAAARRIHHEHPVSLALGTANPNVDFLSGWTLWRESSVPFVMDYRDAWRLDVFSGRTLHSDRSRVARWEKRLQGAAEEIWFVNERIAAWHAERNRAASDRMRVVANGFDEYEVPLRVPIRPERSGRLRFGYVGTVSEHVPIENLIAGWRRARHTSDVLRGAELVIHGYVGHFGMSGSAVDVIARGLQDGVQFAGPVSKATIGEVYSGFDVLVLALGTGRYVTSGKVYEYAATGIPVVSIHDPMNAASDVFRGAPAWDAAASLSTDDIAAALVSAGERAMRETDADRAAAQEWARQYERTRQLEPRIEALRKSVCARGALR